MKKKTYDLALTGVLTALLMAGSFVRIPLPGGVPLTLQLFFVLLGPALLGVRGMLPSLLYLLLGLAGLPVFSGGGGPGYLFSPTFGYLLGFVAGSWLAGYLYPKSPSFGRELGALLCGVALVYGVGGLWFYVMKNVYLAAPVSLSQVFLFGILPFLPGDILKALAVTLIVRKIPAYYKKG
ncbi:MAG TPA: biotin transporter BioY [Firmicutes bacterium]|nr:biotin transporter BioY [Bacillota bacterium]